MPSAGHSVNSFSNDGYCTTPTWREAIKLAVRDPVVLYRQLRIPVTQSNEIALASRQFPVFAPLEFIARMRPGDPHDPLLRQVLPGPEEQHVTPTFVTDPVDDLRFEIAPGLLHKYVGRALLIVTGACAVHCRYCFRRHFPYETTPASPKAWEAALTRIANDSTLEEVILSGGDPLTLQDASLEYLAQRLEAIPHVQRLRIHTRLPIVIPQRVTSELLGWLHGTRLTPIVVVHANHPAEIDEATANALTRLGSGGAMVLNQAVLLRGVNDCSETLARLSRRLIELRVLPYYLHQLDRVSGAAHFEVPIARGREIMEELHRKLPGYAIPRYVQEVPGAPGKTWL